MGLPPFVYPPGRLFGFLSDVAAANGIPLSLMGHRWNEKFINTGDPRSYAMFGDVIWPATYRLHLPSGLRWTRNDKYRQSGVEGQRVESGVDRCDRLYIKKKRQ